MNEENVKSEEKIDKKTNTQVNGSAITNGGTEIKDELSTDETTEVKKEIKEDITSEEYKADENKSNTSEPDLNKDEVSQVLADKSKKFNPKLKKVIAAVLLGIICFGAGAAADRVFVRHGLRGGFNGKNQMRQNMPGNFNGNKRTDQNQNGDQNSNNTQPTPSSGQPQN